ncbi:hypothetical protein JCM3770_006320 [Rhodotorula araucariae]
MAPFSPGARRPAQPGDTASTTSPPDLRTMRVTGVGKIECSASRYAQLQLTATLGNGKSASSRSRKVAR